jgi:hypothetical protein
MTQRPKKLLDQVRDAIRLKHCAYSTEKTYVYWAKRFVVHHDNQHPREMAENEISEFLTYLAVEEHVAASAQEQVLGRGTACRAPTQALLWPELVVRASALH